MKCIAILLIVTAILFGAALYFSPDETTEQGYMSRCIQDGGNEIECKSAWAAEQDKRK
jgi:hypothetical protein